MVNTYRAVRCTTDIILDCSDYTLCNTTVADSAQHSIQIFSTIATLSILCMLQIIPFTAFIVIVLPLL